MCCSLYGNLKLFIYMLDNYFTHSLFSHQKPIFILWTFWYFSMTLFLLLRKLEKIIPIIHFSARKIRTNNISYRSWKSIQKHIIIDARIFEYWNMYFTQVISINAMRDSFSVCPLSKLRSVKYPSHLRVSNIYL